MSGAPAPLPETTIGKERGVGQSEGTGVVLKLFSSGWASAS